MLNDGKGNFMNYTDCLPKDNSTTLDAVFMDINEDGNLDIITTNFVNDTKVKVLLAKEENSKFTFKPDTGLLPKINFFGSTSVLAFKLDKQEYLYFANFKSADVLLKKKS